MITLRSSAWRIWREALSYIIVSTKIFITILFILPSCRSWEKWQSWPYRHLGMIKKHKLNSWPAKTLNVQLPSLGEKPTRWTWSGSRARCSVLITVEGLSGILISASFACFSESEEVLTCWEWWKRHLFPNLQLPSAKNRQAIAEDGGAASCCWCNTASGAPMKSKQ